MYYIGIDIGGTAIKGVVLDGERREISTGSVKTPEDGGEELCLAIAGLVEKLLDGADKSEPAYCGIGCPGVIDSARGVVVFAGNLGLKNFPLAERVTALTGLEVKITNDANAAAFGEAHFGAGSEYENSILVTLGTGVGGGIICGGKLFEGGFSAGAEIGHIVIKQGGRPCTCGRRGCWEAYASATALIEQTKSAMKKHPDSAMWEIGGEQFVNGKTAFDFYERDDTARKVVKKYIKYLACGIVNLANVFRPEVIMLGGGISGQGERLTKPLGRILDRELIGDGSYAPVKIVTAKLGNKAGAYGAAALFMDRE